MNEVKKSQNKYSAMQTTGQIVATEVVLVQKIVVGGFQTGIHEKIDVVPAFSKSTDVCSIE